MDRGIAKMNSNKSKALGKKEQQEESSLSRAERRQQYKASKNRGSGFTKPDDVQNLGKRRSRKRSK